MRRSGTIRPLLTGDLTAGQALGEIRQALAGSDSLALLEREVPMDFPVGESALILMTSGSTGQPKAVGLSAPALVASATSSLARLRAPAGASWSLLLPLHHVAGVQVLIRALINDGAVGSITDEVDFTSVVPTQIHNALNGDEQLLNHLRNCRAVLVGGAPLPRDVRHQAETQGINIVTTYGMTETAGGCIYDGVPLDGAEVRIDESGYVNLSGPMLAEGYLDDADATASAFHNGWFHTQDLGTFEHGQLTIHGRGDAVINSGGEKISLTAVEDAIRSHPMIIDALAAGRADQKWGESLVVGIVASGAIDLKEIRDFVEEKLGRVHAPQGLVFLHEIPRSALGKPHRAILIDLSLDQEWL